MSEKASAPLTPAERQRKSLEDQETLRLQQQEGSVETITGNVVSDYELPAHEAGFVHVQLLTKTENAAAKRFDETTAVQPFYPEEFTRMDREGAFKQYDGVKILHDPRRTEKPTTAAEKSTEKAGQKSGEKPADKSTEETATASASRRSKPEVTAEYVRVFGTQPDAKLTIAELETAIAAKNAETTGAPTGTSNADTNTGTNAGSGA